MYWCLYITNNKVPINDNCLHVYIETSYPGEISPQTVSYTIAENFTSVKNATVTVYWTAPKGMHYILKRKPPTGLYAFRIELSRESPRKRKPMERKTCMLKLKSLIRFTFQNGPSQVVNFEILTNKVDTVSCETFVVRSFSLITFNDEN